MKITKIKALCKEGKTVQIIETGDVRQWIGTKDAIYPADGLTITRESLTSLFDMPDVNKVLEVTCDDLCASDLNPIVRFEEWPQMGSGMPVVYMGKTLIPLSEGGRLYLVRADMVKAAKSTEGYLIFRKAENAKGEPLIVIDDGMLCTGIIRPLPKSTVQAVQRYMDSFAQMQPDGTPEREENEDKEAEAEIAGQIEMHELMPYLLLEGGNDDADYDQGA